MAKKSSRTKAAAPTAAFKLLSDPNRYQAIKLLAGSKKGLLVGDIAETLGMGQSATSHLLGLLYRDDIVAFKKDGRTVRYMLASSSAARALMRIMRAA